jgi:hypothetical protein
MKNIVTLPKDEVVEVLAVVKREKRTGMLIISFSEGKISGDARWLEREYSMPLALKAALAID